ncbi:methylated-DNA--[protein]-cysteine S-methyltransferase [Alkalihalobacillus macyae]|uniref:methylated-DNA--[protein]-cysteine S-methyltransferase n=1 Tax=Guptibacillus hwajinpoensis TaxID=208199 RepID=UPI00273C88A4|nr:methylated-DNA--[protein]-cysteine S-methyltransferase [Alkalihalobacillus macyae]MDP4549644.1 methylated-DNA--[protein]-cysteine S-methyltransferase [Alkalihalobacillus macyae]
MNKLDYKSPIGVLEIVGSEKVVTSIMFVERDEIVHTVNDETPNVLVNCYNQLDEYFKGERHVFTFSYNFEGTEFQRTVWNALITIPYAETGSYKDIAVAIKNEKAVRAVGTANSKNRLSIVIPCHRIVGSNGKLTGYAGGLWRKEWLLQHERSLKKED